MTSSIASTSTSSSNTPRYAIVRHYSVLFSSDKDKKDINRVWHDGRLAHHTYNGKTFLYDEADVQLAEQFVTLGSPIRPGGPVDPPIFVDDSEMAVGEYVVQIQSFQRVTRTDITPLLRAREAARARKALRATDPPPQAPRSELARTACVGSPRPPAHPNSKNKSDDPPQAQTASSARTNPTPSLTSPPGGNRTRRGPLSPHPFKTPFKSPVKRNTVSDDAGGDAMGRSPSTDSVAVAKRRKGLGSDGKGREELTGLQGRG